MSPELLPPPDSGSPPARMFEKLEPVPEPILKRRASRTQVHDAAFVHEVVVDGLNETSVGSGTGIRIGRGGQFFGIGIDIPEALWRAGDPILVGETSVEPLRRIGGRHLAGQHELQFIFEHVGVVRRGEIAFFLTPPAPGFGEAVKDLTRGRFGTEHRRAIVIEDGLAVLIGLGDTRFSEVLRHHDVAGHLGPVSGDLYPTHLENHGPIRVGDLGISQAPLDTVVGGGLAIAACFGEPAGEPQSFCHILEYLPYVFLRPLPGFRVAPGAKSPR